MSEVYVIGTACTAFGKFPDLSFRDLTAMAWKDVFADSGLEDPARLDSAWFGNCGMGTFGQRNIRGQVCLTPLIREGLFPERIGIMNVEGGCATASQAFQGAWKDILSGESQVALAIGVEKTFFPGDAARTLEIFEGGIDQLNPEEWQAYYAAAGEASGKPFQPNAGGGTLFMDTYAMQAAWHMRHRGTTQRDIAVGASKNHWHGSMNPKAQYRFEVSVEEALNDRMVSYPITRSMAAPIGDGAAAAILCSREVLMSLPAAVRERAVRVLACSMTSGIYRKPEEPSLSHHAARRAYKAAGITPEQVSIAEVHDATSFCEIFQAEMMGFCEPGTGGRYVAEGHTTLGGSRPINLSGGLVSKGHPVGATGLSMIHELVLQLRGEAGQRQAANVSVALAENGGGVIGFDEAACVVTLLGR
ncbi:thiolase family protein [Falsigemmobacter intermedius]|uniref:thiolase family protein n=1 Tax=Falsigemmobacter intermedius TaxID=1553448 RepID=UPI003F00EA0E